jgi:hypothetical protein
VNLPENHGRLWKIRTICGQLSDAYAKVYIPPEHLAADEEVHLLFEWRIIFKQDVPLRINVLE